MMNTPSMIAGPSIILLQPHVVRFLDIVLRNVDVGQDITSTLHDRKQLVQQKLEAAGRAFQSNGFINYFFGMQRFGKYHDTHEV